MVESANEGKYATYRDRCVESGDATATAGMSRDGVYRYYLTRKVGKNNDGRKRVLNFIMLNPSKATHAVTDQTIRRCCNFCLAFDYTHLVVTNLYALRSTDPRGLWTHADPRGPDNLVWVYRHAVLANRVIVAWGNHGVRHKAGDAMVSMLRDWGVDPYRLGPLTKQGQPNHPLRLSNSLKPVPL